jgi:transposase InsO family protein
MKDRSGKENEAATVPRRLIDRSGKENEAAMKDRSGKENEAATVPRRLIDRSGKEKIVASVPNYGLIGRSDKIAGLNLTEDDILVPSESSSEDPTDDEEDGPGDLILGKRPAPQLYSLRSRDRRGAQKDLARTKNPGNQNEFVQVEPTYEAPNDERLWVPFQNKNGEHWSYGNHSSRLSAMESTASEDVFQPPKPSLLETIRTAQRGDVLAQKKVSSIEGERVQGTVPESSWKLVNEILYKGEAVYIPSDSALRSVLLRQHHDDPYAGHFGVSRTLELLQRKFYWPGMGRDVAEYVATCDTCQLRKVHRHKPYGELQSLPIPAGPGDSVSLDFITDLPISNLDGQKYDSILVVVDRYVKYAWFIPTTKKLKAPEFATLLIDKVFSQIGFPRSIVSDRGSIFTSKYWKTLCFQIGVKRRLSTAFHPQTDGQTERMNQVLEHYLRTYVNQRQDDWAPMLSTAQFAANNSTNSSIGMSPFRALMGFNPRMPFDQDIPIANLPAVADRVEKLKDLRTELEEHLRAATETQAKYYNQKRQPMQFKVGDQVKLSMKNIKTYRPNKKLDQRHEGPFNITECIGKQAYRLDLPSRWRRIHPVFHVSLLEPYRLREGADPKKDFPPVLIDDEDEEDPVVEWEVEDIVGHRFVKKKGQLVPEYLVKWKGYPTYENSFEPEANLANAQELLDEYKAAAAELAEYRESTKRKRRSK